MQAATRPIKPERLGALGRDNVEAAFARYHADLETFRYKQSRGVSSDGVPFVAEAAFAFRPDSRRQLIAGVNWSPSLKGVRDHCRYGRSASATGAA